MINRTKLTAFVTLALLAAPAMPAVAFPLGKKKVEPVADYRKPNAAQNALIDKSIAREAVIVKTLKARTPIVETYIQNMRTDAVMGQTPESDVHFLGRVNFGKVIGDNTYAQGEKNGDGQKKGILKSLNPIGYFAGLTGALHLTFTRPASCRCCWSTRTATTARPTSSSSSGTTFSGPFPRSSSM